jgi:hypothetical protein
MENGKNEKPDEPLVKKLGQSLYGRRPHETGVNIMPRFKGVFLLSDNLLRARRKCRYSGGGRYCIQFRKSGTNYLLGIQRRKISEKGISIPHREFKK